MTFERYIAVSQPLRASQLCTIKRARYMLLLVLTVFFLINAHFLWTFHLIPVVSHCIPLNDQSLFIRYFTWIDSFKYSFCPFTLLITLNVLIIRSLLHARNNTKFLQQQPCKDKPLNSRSTTTYSISFSSTSTTTNSANTMIKKKQDNHPRTDQQQPAHASATRLLSHRRVNRRLTTMLLTVSFAFCICSMPISIMQLIDAIYSDVEQRSPTMNARIAIGKIIAEISQYLNHCKTTRAHTSRHSHLLFIVASNFFLYAFTGRVFRHELARLFRCHRLSSLFPCSSVTPSKRLTKRAKQLMLSHSPTQGVHEHFYANGKRHTRIIVAPKRSSTQLTGNFSDHCTYRQSICSTYSSVDMPVAHPMRRTSLLVNDEQDEQFLTCYHHPSVGQRASTETQATTIMFLDSPPPSRSSRTAALNSFVEAKKKQEQAQTMPLLCSFTEPSTSGHRNKPYGFTDVNSDA